ncbi:hypothetical protein PL263_10510 [Methylomonas sp. EFPC3]|uniref:hypothetical protein n=1 Tax=Methylomonas sp. EFPC3 TaxID=3021710 RepID=UPI002417F8DA|nr:hypothetical protein [Methylomonas sp. EFPC3]WFP48545.1 hypothetical protein PL263_10510 [Methylomonas sp. EFPC3]
MQLATHADQSAAALAVTSTVAKLAEVCLRADEYLTANAPRYLKHDRQKLIDLGMVALMEYEDELFNWTHLRLILIERLGVYETGSLPWFIDIDRSTDRVLTVRHENGKQQLQFEIGQLLLAALIHTR